MATRSEEQIKRVLAEFENAPNNEEIRNTILERLDAISTHDPIYDIVVEEEENIHQHRINAIPVFKIESLEDMQNLRDVLSKERDAHLGVIMTHQEVKIEPRKELVVPPWFIDLPIMQQSVLMQATRGPDGVRKDHPVKAIHRVYRASVLKAGYYGRMLEPGEKGDDFMSLDITRFGWMAWEATVKQFFNYRDELPFHYVDHLRRAVQIVGYKHPDSTISSWFNYFYREFCRRDNVKPETEEEMDARLNDKDQKHWT